MESEPEPADATSTSPSGDEPALGAIPHVTASWIAHAAVLLASAFATPPFAAADAEAAASEQTYLIQSYLRASAEREAAERIPDPGRPAACGCGEEGSLGAPFAVSANRRYGVMGPADNADPHIAREAYSHDPSIPIGPSLLPVNRSPGDTRAPLAPWGRDDALGNDEASARGHMWGEEIADAFGSGGLSGGRRARCVTCDDTGEETGARRFTRPAGATVTEPGHLARRWFSGDRER